MNMFKEEILDLHSKSLQINDISVMFTLGDAFW